MKHPWPHFKVMRVLDDGSKEALVVPVSQLPSDTRFGRRGFFGVGLAATALGVVAAASRAKAQDAANCRISYTRNGETVTVNVPEGSVPTYATCVCNCEDSFYNPSNPSSPIPPGASPGAGNPCVSGPCGGPVPPGCRCTCNCVEEH
jgi:hypothetical protein